VAAVGLATDQKQVCRPDAAHLDEVLHGEWDALRDDRGRLTDFCLGSELPEVLTLLR
jgi:hypothetical protein